MPERGTPPGYRRKSSGAYLHGKTSLFTRKKRRTTSRAKFARPRKHDHWKDWVWLGTGGFVLILFLIFLITGDFSTAFFWVGMISFLLGIYCLLALIWKKDQFSFYAISLIVSVIFLSSAGRLDLSDNGGINSRNGLSLNFWDELGLQFANNLSIVLLALGMVGLFMVMVGIVNSIRKNHPFKYYVLALLLAVFFLLIGNKIDPVTDEEFINYGSNYSIDLSSVENHSGKWSAYLIV